MNTVNNATNLSWDQRTNLATAERPPVDNFCTTVWLIFGKKTLFRGNAKIPFPSSVCYTYLWNVCLLLKKSGKVVISVRIQTYAAFLHQTLPVNSQVFPVLRHMWLYCCPPTVVAPCGVARSRSTSLHVKKAILHWLTLMSWHTVHWYTLRKHHLLHFHCRLCFKLRQLKLIECKCLSLYCQLYNVSHVLIHIHRTF